MQFLDINGVELTPGCRVAFARTRGGTLATGTVLRTSRVFGGEVRIRLNTNKREVNLPYHEEKYLVIAPAPPPQESLSTRALRSVLRLAARGVDPVDIGNVRADLGLPFSESHDLYLALEALVESGEIRRAAWPRYAYTAAE